MINDTGEMGVVIDIHGNKASVRFEKSESCKQCSAGKICQPDDAETRRIVALNSVNAQIGQLVTIKEDSSFLLLLSFMQFGLPLLGLLSGIFFTYAINLNIGGIPQELVMFGCGIAGMLFAGFIAWLWAKRKSRTTNSCFEIISIIPTENSLQS